jgi:hypothetical protein
MRFRTEYGSEASRDIQLTPDRPLLFLGSCFSDNIGSRLQQRMWEVSVNPCGVLYNPASIAATIMHAMDEEAPKVSLQESTGLWFSWDFSTLFSATTRDSAVQRMTAATDSLARSLRESAALLITFGTAWIYELGDSGRVVANCHKQPARLFRCRIMSVEEIVGLWCPLIERLTAINPSLKVIFTVSPVRHLADGFAGNSRSKARLIMACEQLAEMPQCGYFSAYEILMDDLRDYRFYADDLLHPSDMAADYIMEKFVETYVPESALPLLAAGLKEYKRLHHRQNVKG